MNLPWRVWVAMGCFLSLSAVHADTSLEELEVLANRGAWSEVVSRLGEIPVGGRTAKWHALVERAALKYLEVLTTEGPHGAEVAAQALLNQYPLLGRSHAFLSQHKFLWLSAAETCFAVSVAGEDCVQSLHRAAQAWVGDKETLFRAGTLARRQKGGGAELAFLKLALLSTDKSALCRDSRAKEWILSGLALPRGEARDVAAEMARHACWAELREGVLQRLRANPSAHFLEASCPLLRHDPASRAVASTVCRR